MTNKQKLLAETVIAYLRENPEDHDQEHIERTADFRGETLEEIDRDSVGEDEAHRIGRCGSVGCIAGWICYVGATRKQLDSSPLFINDLAASLVGLDSGEFESRVYSNPDRNHALSELESMIAQTATWQEVMDDAENI